MKILYIVSSPNGGSTLLSLVLGKHPLSAGLGEVSFIPKLLALRELCTCGELLAECPAWSKVFDNLASRTGVDMRTSPYSLYLGDAIKTKLGSGLVDHAYQTHWRRTVAKVRGGVDTAALFATPRIGAGLSTLPSIRKSVKNTISLYESAAEAWDKKLIIDASKLPRKAPHLYLQDPDRVRILHLVRDGRGVVASRTMKDMPLLNAAERWNHYHSLTLRILHRWVPPAHRRMMRYEDFVTEPESNLRSICDWLEIPYSSDMLEFQESQVVHSAGGNPTRFKISGGIRPVDDRWRTVLSTEDLKSFEHIAGEMNRKLGYE